MVMINHTVASPETKSASSCLSNLLFGQRTKTASLPLTHHYSYSANVNRQQYRNGCARKAAYK